MLTSAKMGIGIDELLERIVRDVPPPKGDPDAPLKALLFDSWYDPYRGVTSLVRIVDGRLVPRTKIRAMGTGLETDVEALGVFRPQRRRRSPTLSVGEVGSFWGNIKDLHSTRIGDTITEVRRPTPEPLPGFAEAKPMVFAGLFPTDADEYENLRDAMEKLRLNDASFTFEPENSTALGFGFRCGFLGLLHMEIVQERLEREFDLDLITTAPGVNYRVTTTEGRGPRDRRTRTTSPPPTTSSGSRSPTSPSTIITRDDFLGGLLKLCEDRRGTQKSLEYLASNRVVLDLRLPAERGRPRLLRQAEVHLEGLRLLRLRVRRLPRRRPRQARHARQRGAGRRALAHRPPRGGRRQGPPPGREDERNHPPPDVRGGDPGRDRRPRSSPGRQVSAIRKNVLAKCYGGDITRKRKLLEKQKEGKKRMKRVGRVDIPQEAFLAVLKVE